ncbi:MAG: SLC13 family permease [Acidobacteria bacterium]|nr:MAG: SLC13 family permease [Acidobacteriota bacterium]REK04609.1 MAG: SLC13 family permease [Acidobacteriota bacterium]
MTLEIGFLFALLGAMVYLFLTEKIPVDLTAFLGLVILIFAGYVAPEDAFSGFASSAVITMLAIFIVSAALLNTGVADGVAGRIHRWVGSREIPLVVTIMIVAGVLSAFMNNIAATAVLMPAVASLGRKADLPPSRLFMPLAFGAILGGTTTLVGTPPNLLAGAMLEERGMQPFGLFDFTPIGLLLLGLGTVFMATLGRRLLPRVDAEKAGGEGGLELARLYQLEGSLLSIAVPKDSRLDGATLEETDLGSTLGVQILEIRRDRQKLLAPSRTTRLQAGDELLVQGKLEDLREILRVRGVSVADAESGMMRRPQSSIRGVRAKLPEGSPLIGRSLRELDFRGRYGCAVIEIEREGEAVRDHLASEILMRGDVVIGIGVEGALDRLEEEFDLVDSSAEVLESLSERSIFLLDVPATSPLVGVSLGVSRMGELMGLTVIGIVRGSGNWLPVTADEVIEAGDKLLVSGERSRIQGLVALDDLRLESVSSLPKLESESVLVAEATIAPRSGLDGKTLRELDFRDRYGVQVLGVWREGSAIRERLAQLALRVGDGLLLQGPREKIAALGSDRDFIVLADVAVQERRTRKAPFAIAGLALMVALVVAGIQPIQVSAFAAATLVILSGALTMQEAYRAIEWRAIFLVAAVLPVGGAMEKSGAALLLAQTVIDGAGPLGPYAVLGSLIVLSSLLSQGLDGAPAVVLLTPVVLQAAEGLGLSPYPLMMGVALAASAAFMTPFSHKANLLVMGLGGYRSMDYVRVGTPLTIVLLALMTFLVPFFFPF